jgi:hypothetical protein
MIGRRVEIATVTSGAMPGDTDFHLARPDQLGPAGAIEPSGRPLRQFLHGGMGLDDPIEVAVAEGTGVAR